MIFLSSIAMPAVAVAAQAATDPTTQACGAPAEASALCLSVFRATGNSVLAQGAEALIVRPFRITVIIVVAFLARRLLGRIIQRLVTGVQGRASAVAVGQGGTSVRGARRADTIAALLRSITGFAIWTIAAFMILGELGVNLGPLIAGAGIVGIAIGFGAQNLVRDFVSGIFMLVEDQYGVGDVIDVGPAVGTVEAVSLRTTRLRDVNGTVWHLPNGHIERVGNKSQQWSRALLDVEVSYQTDLTQATDVIKHTADTLCAEEEFAGLVLAEPEVWGVEDLGADSVKIRLVLKTEPNQQFKVARELRARIKQAFDRAGIEIPFPQRSVWHRSASPVDDPDGAEPVAHRS
ncbi:MAG TPA: mechanosensitive ion channel family protein [Acidimicrobiales bacterium]